MSKDCIAVVGWENKIRILRCNKDEKKLLERGYFDGTWRHTWTQVGDYMRDNHACQIAAGINSNLNIYVYNFDTSRNELFLMAHHGGSGVTLEKILYHP